MDALPEAIVHIVMVGAVPNNKLRVHFFMIIFKSLKRIFARGSSQLKLT